MTVPWFWRSKQGASASFEIEEHVAEPVSKLSFGAQSGELSVLSMSVEPFLDVDFGAQSGELCVLRAPVEPFLEVDFGAEFEVQNGEL